MANHRSDRRGSRRRSAVTPTPAPARAGRRRAAEPTPVEAAPVRSVAPSPAPSRASRPSRSRTTRSARQPSARDLAGAHASGHASTRRSLLRSLPSAPLLLGLAILAISASGAIKAAGTDSDYEASVRFSQASALTGTSEVSRVNLLDPRDTVVSRDAPRDSATTSADDKLAELADDQLKDRDATLAKFADQNTALSDKIKRNLWLLPIKGYHLTARFGDWGLWSGYHTGLDFAARYGTKVTAIANGTITWTGYDGSYGIKTVLTLADGTEIWYCHQSSTSVKVGQFVEAGQTLGAVGSTGHTTGPHLHLEVRPGGGDPVDPYTALIVHGAKP